MNLDASNLPVPLVQGEGTLSQLGSRVAGLGVSRVLLVTDKGVSAAGHLEPALDSLKACGCDVSVFDNVHANPTELDVLACVAAAKNHGAEALIGFGGGSSMDAAKGCNFILTNGGAMSDYWGVDKATQPMLPFVAVPTTAGTGSECQRFALISDSTTHRKMACGDIKARARFAILDPRTTLTQPPFVAACTGVDAVAHAVETAVTVKRNSQSLEFSYDAFRRLSANIHAIMRDPGNVIARAEIQLGASLAGAAIECSMLGAAHAAANPLTAMCGTIHGQAVGIMLPGVVRLNGEDGDAAAAYRDLTAAAGLPFDGTDRGAVTALADWLSALLHDLDLHRPLRTLGVTREMIPRLSAGAAEEWTGTFNPRRLTSDDFARLYSQVLD
ncbi:MAG: iron-containing alcohol dehydrogenase [Verrucomicrobia bacterium]|nr:iron-containing alcohol dehydrogenase [Verrucomicrobiota bacterium]MDA1086324.1 iron-containing alcohol dehydrogenase [Verrucomicrobiota bacterium]